MEKTIIDQSLIEVANILQPLRELQSPEEITQFIKELGWYSESSALIDLDISELTSLVFDLTGKVQAVVSANSDGEYYSALADLAEHITLIIERIITDVPQISNAIENLPDLIGPVGHVAEVLARNIIDYLVVRYLISYHPKIYAIFNILGLLDISVINEEITIRHMRWERIPWIFSDPIRLFNAEYSWESNFNIQRFLTKLNEVLAVFPLAGGIYQQDRTISLYLNNYESYTEEIRLPIFQHFNENSVYTELGLNISAWKDNNDLKGLAIYPTVVGGFAISEDFSENWQATLKGNMELESGLALLITPPYEFRLDTGLFTNPQQSIEAVIEAGINRKANFHGLNLLFGTQEGTHLGYQSVGTKIIASTSLNKQEISIELNIDHLELAISTAGGDGFVSKIFSGVQAESICDLVIGWSNLDGVYFRGSGALEITIPVHKKLGPLTIDSVYIVIAITGEISMTLAVTGTVKIDKISISVDKIGLNIPISFPEDNSGNLGPLKISSPSFKHPDGGGLVVETDSFTIGGNFDRDLATHSYSGMLQVDTTSVGLTAIGIISTRLPDGSKGYSLLGILGVEFDPGISLGYGFFLTGVGGLFGLHRTMLTDVIRNGIKNHTLDSILFPSDPVLNATKIISDLRSIFPPTEGRHVFGPMCLITWGKPPLIRGEIAVLIEIPHPVRIAILGLTEAILPNKDKKLLELHEAVMGVIDFEKQTFAYDSSLYDSHIATFTLAGDTVMRLKWGNNPIFILAAGGFNPRFDPPATPVIPGQQRLTVSIGLWDNPRISLEGYFAITSNTIQFGARLSIYAKKGKFNAQGDLGFDTLIIFSPFSFIAEMGASVEIKIGSKSICSAGLDMRLSGPGIWRAKGEVKFKVWKFKKSIGFNKSWGNRQPVALPDIDPTEQLLAALHEPGNWVGVLPAYTTPAAMIKQPTSSQSLVETVVVHPIGTLEVRQRVLPLNMVLSKFGNYSVTGTNYFTIDMYAKVEAVDVQLAEIAVQDYMAPAQYTNMSNGDRLSSPSFVEMDSGAQFSFGDDMPIVRSPVPYLLEYETVIIDEELVAHVSEYPTRLPKKFGARYKQNVATKRVGIRNSGRNKFINLGDEPKVKFKDQTYALVSTKDLSVIADVPIEIMNEFVKNAEVADVSNLTYMQAKQIHEELIYQYPDRKSDVQVISSFEVKAA